MPGITIGNGKTEPRIHIDYSYGPMTIKKACKLLNGGSLGYMDASDIGERLVRAKIKFRKKKGGRYMAVCPKSREKEILKAWEG